MGGGLMQLVAYGAQDIYLTGQPQITFFKSVYRRYTNFSSESIIQTIEGNIGFGKRVSVTITRNGDLLNGITIEYNPNDILNGITTGSYVGANIGHSLLNTIELQIGGQLIDRQYGTWLTIWDYLTTPNPTGVQGVFSNNNAAEPTSLNTPTNQDGQVSTLYDVMSFNHRGSSLLTSANDAPNKAYIPLKFWFCRNPGLALPLIALQYQDVTLNLYFNNYSSICANATPTGKELGGFKVYGEYVYLDTTERRQFAQNAHEYLIDQLQINKSSDSKVLLSFYHPVKELVWISTPVDVSSANMSGGSSPSSTLSYGDYKLVLNGTDRFTERPLSYFTRFQVNQYHTGFGSVLWPNSIAVYSFSLRPEDNQPSGTCNFSRIDTSVLMKPGNQSIEIYAVNYNILRIMSGMGGLGYSN
jgi:hypothetical protein